MRPESPYLVVRDDLAFWVEIRPPEHCSATWQAFRDGCFRNAWCYDSTGGKWPILAATLKQRPSFVHRILPWKRVTVELCLGPRMEADLGAVVSQLTAVLRSNNDFCEFLPTPPSELLARLQRARTPADIIDIARG